MSKYFLLIFGLLLLLGYIPLLILNGSLLQNHIPEAYKTVFAYFVLLFPPIVGFLCLFLSSLQLKQATIEETERELKVAKVIQDIELHSLTDKSYSAEQIEALRIKVNRLNNTGLIYPIGKFYYPVYDAFWVNGSCFLFDSVEQIQIDYQRMGLY